MSFRLSSKGGFLVVEIRGPFDSIPDHVVEAVELSDRVRLIIDTPGGDAASAIRLSRAILTVPDSRAEVFGMACSAGAVIAASARRCTVAVSGRFMVHRSHIAVFGGVSDLQECIGSLEKADSRIRAILERRCRPELVDLWLDGRDHWLTAAEALAAGLVDEIVQDAPHVIEPTTFESRKRSPAEPTEAERVTLAILDALGPIEVSHWGAFASRLDVWFRERVREKAAPG